jgi:hypothetical protein
MTQAMKEEQEVWDWLQDQNLTTSNAKNRSYNEPATLF